MVFARLCETARLVFFSASPRLLFILRCESETLELFQKCESATWVANIVRDYHRRTIRHILAGRNPLSELTLSKGVSHSYSERKWSKQCFRN